MNKDANSIPDGRFAPEDWEYILLQMVNDRSGVDFGMYRMPTFRRRYLKRMNLTEARDLRDYVKQLEDDPDQLDLLVTDLLIGVTSFFRDQAAFKVLDQQAVKSLFTREDNSNVRCWVAGCSNGMEAYSIAMLMYAAMEAHGGSFTIFATDVSRSALENASKGIYTVKQFETVPDEYRKYFTETDKGWRICREVRSRMVFSHHDILSDPPFAHMDLVSCRNMMIYLKPRAQEIVLGRLNYSLSLGGYLFLGSGETPGRHQDNLETVDSKWRLFRKTGETVISVDMFPFEKQTDDSFSVFGTTRRLSEDDDEHSARSRTFTSCLEERFFPDCVFVDEDYRILFINGDMNSYLTIPSGIPGGSLLEMLPGSLKSSVRAGIRRARGRYSRIRCETKEDVTIFVSCISPLEMSGVFLVEFVREDGEDNDRVARIECSESDISILEEQIALLESDLATTRRELRSRTGELQASNEELQTTNEEIRSANEELTASNEELLASNEELKRLNHELVMLTDDMENLLVSMDVGSLFLDNDLRIRRFNPAVTVFFNITEGDISRKITDFTTALDSGCLEELVFLLEKVSETQIPAELSLIADVPGHWIAKITPYHTSRGENQGTVITIVDVSVIREGELSLVRSERKFRGLFNGFPMGALLVSVDEETGELFVQEKNPVFLKLTETHGGIENHKDFREGILKQKSEFEFTYQKSDFRCRVFKPADFARSLCITIRDVTVLNRASRQRQKLEKRLHDAQILAGMGLWEYHRESKTVTLSQEAAMLFKLKSSEPMPVGVIAAMIEDFQGFYDEARGVLEGGGNYTGIVTLNVPDTNEKRHFRVSCYRLEENGEALVYGYALDISQEVRGEEILKQAHDKLQETQRIAKVGVIEMEWNENYTLHRERFSPAALQVLKLQDEAPADFFNRCMEEDLADSLIKKLKKCAISGKQLLMDIPMRNGNLEKIFIQLIASRSTEENRGNVLSLVIMDITRRHQLENELKHSEKLRSVGELAGGIAHDFNNQLMGIVGFAECLKKLCGSTEEQEYIKGILNSSERAGALVRQLLAFSRKGLSHIAPFDLHHLIDEVIALLKRSIDRRIEIRRNLRASNAMVLGDASEMNNAILNLALNARDAIDGNGEMTFATSDAEPGLIRFQLLDTGRGMTPDVIEKVFEPFFTTKPLGIGTGMGLPAVYGTIEAHNGSIEIQSQPGEGTTVEVILPVTELEPKLGDTKGSDPDVPMKGTVLLVDDEEIVRTVLSKLIRSLGFDVLTATNGVEAVDIYRHAKESIKLVLMDMTMPRMNGMDAFAQMKDLDPGVKVIILSGHSAESTSTAMIRLGIRKVLQKPVMLSVLSSSIREVISS